jgi:hypothetical protein
MSAASIMRHLHRRTQILFDVFEPDIVQGEAVVAWPRAVTSFSCKPLLFINETLCMFALGIIRIFI